MKCPYRINRSFYKGVTHGTYALKSNDIREDFAECYGEECPLYDSAYHICIRANKERQGN